MGEVAVGREHLLLETATPVVVDVSPVVDAVVRAWPASPCAANVLQAVNTHPGSHGNSPSSGWEVPVDRLHDAFVLVGERPTVLPHERERAWRRSGQPGRRLVHVDLLGQERGEHEYGGWRPVPQDAVSITG